LLLSFSAIQGVIRLAVVGAGLAAGQARGVGPVSIFELFGVLAVLGLAVVTVRQIGEWAAQRAPDRLACRLSPLAGVIVFLAAPIWTVHRRLVRSPRNQRSGVVTPLVTEEEIKTLVDAGEEGGAIEVGEKNMILSIFELGETLAREVMVPRIDIQAFDERQSLREVTDALLATGHSRAPVFRADIDSIVGIVYVKDMLGAFRQGRQEDPVGTFMRPAVFVPEAKKADELLADLQARRVHMAVVVDEYGGTAGVVTLEDLVEEIVGEIRDEYDAAEEAAFQPTQGGGFLFSGRIGLDDVNDLTGASLAMDTGDTLGGYISGVLGRIPAAGDVVEAGGLRLTVEQVAGRRIQKVSARRIPDPGQEPDAR
jgi:CBS domain containing-hemolysin-like protein